jgi:peroxiredoxin
VGQEQADRLTRVGRELARTDTWRGAARFVQTASVLARIPSHYVTAVRVTDDGIEALRESRPGLLHPGIHEDEREEVELRYIAVLMQLQGQALHNLGRGKEAEEVLREAITLYPVAASYAVLGGLLLDQGRDAEAFDLFVAALARGFVVTEAALEEQTRASALEAAARIGASAEVVDRAIAFAAELVEEARDLEIVADALDLPAPDFELGDTAGGTWRLSELAGKVVVLNYWATWCGPCIAEMPYYQSLVDEYANATDVVFLAISTDSDAAVVAPFIDESGYTFHVLFDQGSAADFRISGVPATFLIGKDGLIKYRTSGFPGPQPYLREMHLRIEALRAAGQRPSP